MPEDCARCGIAKRENDRLRCMKYHYLMMPQTPEAERECSYFTCLAFAAKLVLGEKKLKDCPPIWEPGKEDLLEPLQGIMEALGV